MATCVSCGAKGLFLRINKDGLCPKCDAREKDPDYIAAREYVTRLSDAVSIAAEDTVILPSRGAKQITMQMDACTQVLELIEKWKDYPRFFDAFFATTVPYEGLGGGNLTHPIFGFHLIPPNHEFDFEKNFAELREKIEKIHQDCSSTLWRAYDYSKLFHIVGVTFYNGKKSRQAIIRRLGKGYKEYDDRLSLERFEFEGEDAVGVFFGEDQIGNISRRDLPWLLEHWDEYAYISAYEVVSGYDTLGVHIRACFRRKQE